MKGKEAAQSVQDTLHRMNSYLTVIRLHLHHMRMLSPGVGAIEIHITSSERKVDELAGLIRMLQQGENVLAKGEKA